MTEVKGKKIKELEEQKSIQLSDDIIIETDPETGDPKTGRTKIGALFLALHPIGSIYLSTAATNPGSIFGGTWTAWGAGRVPVGISASDEDFKTAEKTGGAKDHKHTTAGHKLTTAEMPSHKHDIVFSGTKLDCAVAYSGINGPDYWRLSPALSTEVTGEKSLTIGNTGSGGSHGHGDTGSTNALPPYITCYMWKRTA